MAHEFESGMFVRIPAWHELGLVLEHDPDTPEQFQCSGLDWTVRKESLLYNFNGNMQKSSHYGVIRESDGQFLGVCKDRYTLFQNSEQFDWCDPLVKSGLYKWESAGSLKQGQTCWALLNSGESEIIKGDKSKHYLLITWSHDGSKSVMIRPTSIRVVCNNTLTQAVREDGKRDRVKHTMSMKMRLEDVRQYYEQQQEYFNQEKTQFIKMLNTRLTPDMKSSYINTMSDYIYGTEQANSKRSQTIRLNFHNNLSTMIDSKASGQLDLGIQNTLYGAFQATSEYLEHYMSQKGDKEGYSILFGSRGKQIDFAKSLAISYSDGHTPFLKIA